MAFSKDINELVTEDTTGLLNKHESWERVTLQDVVEVVNGYAFSSSGFNTGKGLPLIRIRDIVSGKTDTTYEGDYSKDYIVNSGDLLVGMDGDFHSAFWRSGIALLNQRVCKLTANENFYNQKFLAYLLPGYLGAINQSTSAVTVKHLSSKTIQSIPLPLPTRKEQDRLVEKLEELFSEFDNGIEELKAAQTKLSQYRQSLLKSAVEGSLTERWRAENRAQVQETGEQLLARILKQRREQWQQQKLAEFAEKGKTPPKNWQDAYPEPVQPDTTDLPKLPEGWVWASVDQLALNKRYGSSSKTNDDSSGVPVLRMGNIQDGKLDYSNLKYLPVDHKEFPDLLLNNGDLLFNRTNSAELVGKSAVYRDIGKPVSYASYLISVTFTEHFLPEIAAHYINSVLGKKWLAEVMNQTAGQANVNGTKLGELAIPLPPFAEQLALIQGITNEFDSIDRQIEATALGLKQSEAQRKNILKSAFSGQLVSQDPNDEPASVLLEKIKREREALAKKPKTKQIKTKSAMKKITIEELAKWVGNYKGNSFTFDELQTAFQGDYDQLKDCVFEILSAKKPLFKQVFDQKLNTITFIKEDK
ncbi:restriction endonuclease subunit S [Alishewanella jeotgali]|uniref:Type I restriction-modification system specificity n=1 Tax=Alishewanella jeotgali KCTC 22429 TaxID=1129374 RepID=H3ZD23_9ALTE|nr:restriction endonuclease subunit S [Alishewanella jeotgali]EHR41524.1 type I restriction-modification system specificity [Alishewanella jeotgali KCTC 22429]